MLRLFDLSRETRSCLLGSNNSKTSDIFNQNFFRNSIAVSLLTY
jgi:hypothetical protein